MPLSLTSPLARVATATGCLVGMALSAPSPAAAQNAGEFASLLAHSWASLRAGAAQAAFDAAETALVQGSDGNPTLVDEARLARCAALYALGRTREAATDARTVADLEAALATVAADALPGGFAAWARAASEGEARRAPGPAIALGELNPEREVREVTTHFEMDVEIVRIPVIVEDFEGNFVTDLGLEDFSVVDGAPPARPVYQLINEDEPSSVGVLIDASEAARAQTPAILGAAIQLIGQLRAEDEVFLLQFGDAPDFLSDFAPGGVDLLPALAEYEAGGGRALRDALATGLIRMRDASYDKKSLVVIAFGDDEGSETTAPEVRSAAQRDGVSIHTILLPAELERWRPGAPDEAPTFLVQRLAFETGGLVALRPATAERYGGLAAWVDGAARDVGAYIRHQYLLQFESFDPPPPGEWRPLRVQVQAPPETIERVRARSGYVR